MTARSSTLAKNIDRVRETIATAAAQSGRDASEIKLVAVSKTKSAAEVAGAAALGLRCFGENRVQEAAAKIPQVDNLAGGAPLEWHLVGTLQRNKVKLALNLFAILQSVDSLSLAEELDRRAGAMTVPALLEVYLGDDPNRPGFRAAGLTEQLPRILALTRMSVQGLMTVAPLGLNEHDTRAAFARLRDLRDRLVANYPGLALPELSMGMTDDYPLAIAEGATIVRIGRAIFGERPFH